MSESSEYERGRADAAKQAMGDQISGLHRRVSEMERQLAELAKSFEQYVAVAKGARDAAREAAQKTVSTREFYIGVGLVIAAFVGLFLGVKG